MANKVTDEELILKFKQGNESCFNELMQRYKPLIESTSRRYIISNMEREDLVQEARIVLYEAITKFCQDKKVPFAAFYKRLLYNRICVLMRRCMATKRKLDRYSEEGRVASDDYVFEQTTGYQFTQTLNPVDVTLMHDNFASLFRNLSVSEKEALHYIILKPDSKNISSTTRNAISRVKMKLKKSLRYKE